MSNSNDNPDCNEYDADGMFAGNYQRPCAEGKTYWRKIYQMAGISKLNNSHDNLDCNKYDADGTFAGNYLRPCTEGEAYCRKIYQMI